MCSSAYRPFLTPRVLPAPVSLIDSPGLQLQQSSACRLRSAVMSGHKGLILPPRRMSRPWWPWQLHTDALSRSPSPDNNILPAYLVVGDALHSASDVAVRVSPPLRCGVSSQQREGEGPALWILKLCTGNNIKT
ncbi:hypothetical protein AAFF_G00062950 [Aldrovandia affinis]|uniref:Uncharacterized protein n=1 Tax=Aldrovandia affinis TaxID=143900 RepID=A0AAD7WDY1_9TELE|nr:hypothetical protein AAFF_G00062950 [Aldrovandia affinis]